MFSFQKTGRSKDLRWLKNRHKCTKQQLLLVEIEKILAEHPDSNNYGSKHMHTALKQKGINVSERTVYRAMKAGGYIHKHRKPHGLTKVTTEVQEKENVIKCDFSSDKPLDKASYRCYRSTMCG